MKFLILGNDKSITMISIYSLFNFAYSGPNIKAKRKMVFLFLALQRLFASMVDMGKLYIFLCMRGPHGYRPKYECTVDIVGKGIENKQKT